MKRIYEYTILVEFPGGRGEYDPTTGELKLSAPISALQRELILRRCELMVERRKRIDSWADICAGLVITLLLGGFAAITMNLLKLL